MKKNMGMIDRLIRLGAAITVVILYVLEIISGPVALVLGIIAIAFLATSLIGWCPLYLPFKISTQKGSK